MGNPIFRVSIILIIAAIHSFAQIPMIKPDQTVNPITGEMGFALPLGDVKGTNGHDFPVNLTYQAGIRYYQEASEVGLGFSLGAGAITTRTVFVPDNNQGGPSTFFMDEDHDKDIAWWVYVISVVSFVIAVIIFIVSLPIGGAPGAAAGVTAGTVVGILFAAIGVISSAVQLISLLSAGGADYTAGDAKTLIYRPYYDKLSAKRGRGILNGGVDDLPDVYFINTPFLNGELAYGGKDGSNYRFVLRSLKGSGDKNRESVKATFYPNNTTGGSFIVTLQDGTRLLFEKAIKSNFYSINASQSMSTSGSVEQKGYSVERNIQPVAVGWMLTKVLFNDYNDATLKGSFIQFSYSEQIHTARQLPLSIKGGGSKWDEDEGVFGSTQVAYGGNYLQDVYLTLIETPIHKAVFTYSDNRKDNLWFNSSDMTWWGNEENANSLRNIGIPAAAYCIPSGSAAAAPHVNRKVLDRIQFVAKGCGGNDDDVDKVLKTVVFNTDYFLRPQSLHSYTKASNRGFVAVSENGACLTLESIDVYGADGTRLPPIRFTYMPNNPPQWDPDKVETPYGPSPVKYYIEDCDIWGYYRKPKDISYDVPFQCDKNRAASADAWSLQQIHLPNGMQIKWEYEPNLYDRSNQVAVRAPATATYPLRKGDPLCGGGIRVKKVIATDYANKTNTWRYAYTCVPGVFEDATDSDADTSNTSGHATIEPFNSKQVGETADYRTELRRHGGIYTPSKVAYEMVQVIKNYSDPIFPAINGSAPNGYSVFEFITSKDHPNGGEFGDIDSSWMRGYIKKISHYNSNNALISQQTNDLDFLPSYASEVALETDIEDTLFYEYQKYSIGWTRNKEATEKVNNVIKRTTYQFAGSPGELPTTETKKVMTEKYYRDFSIPDFYPYWDGDGGMAATRVLENPAELDFAYVGRDLYIGILSDYETPNGKKKKLYRSDHSEILPPLWGVAHALCMEFRDLDNSGGANDLILFVNDGSDQASYIYSFTYFNVHYDNTLMAFVCTDQNERVLVGTGNVQILPVIKSCAVSEKYYDAGSGKNVVDLIFFTDLLPNDITGNYSKNFYMLKAFDFVSGNNHNPPYFDKTETPIDGRLLMANTMRIIGGTGGANGYDVEMIGRANSENKVFRYVVTNVRTEGGKVKYDNISSGEWIFSMGYDPMFGEGYKARHIVGVYPLDAVSGSMLYGVCDPDRGLHMIKIMNVPVQTDIDGEPNEIWEYNSGGEKKVTVSLPAFIKYPAMRTTKNMIAQKAQTIVYEKVNSSPILYPSEARSSNVTIWNNQTNNLWLPCSTFVWKTPMDGSGNTPPPLVEFPFANPSTRPTVWKFSGGATQANIYGNPVETKNPLGVFSSVIYGAPGKLPIANLANCRRAHGFFASFEDGEEAVFTPPNQTWTFQRVSEKSKTGKKSLKITNPNTAEWYFESGWQQCEDPLANPTKFHFSGWVLSNGPQTEIFFYTSTDGTIYLPGTFSNVYLNSIADLNKWTLLEGTFIAPAGTKYFGIRVDNNGLGIDGSVPAQKDVYFDDLKFYPDNAKMSVVYYDPVWQSPNLDVDANENPGKLIAFDGFGREHRLYKVDKTKSPQETDYGKLLQVKTYGLTMDGIVLIAPKKDDVYFVGSSMGIDWVYDLPNKTVSIYLSYNNGAWQTSGISPITFSTAGRHQYLWTGIPSLMAGQYRLKIQDANDAAKYAISQPFSILVDGVWHPNKNDRWLAGTTQEIVWRLNGATTVDIFYFNGTAWEAAFATGISNSLGIFKWQIPEDMKENTVARIRLVDNGNATNKIESESFTIMERPNFVKKFLLNLFGK